MLLYFALRGLLHPKKNLNGQENENKEEAKEIHVASEEFSTNCIDYSLKPSHIEDKFYNWNVIKLKEIQHCPYIGAKTCRNSK